MVELLEVLINLPCTWLLADDRVRLSRLLAALAVVFGLTAFPILWFAYAVWWLAIVVALVSVAFAISVWKLGDWWQFRQALRRAQIGMPNRQRGFEVQPRSHVPLIDPKDAARGRD